MASPVRHEPPSHQAPTVIVGVDGSKESKAALRWALNYAEAAGARVRAVIAWRWPMSLLVTLPILEVVDPADEARQRLELAVADVLSQGPSPVKVETRACYGDAVPVLLDQASRASLLVLGAVERGGHHGPSLGYVGEQCLRHAACPVVLVRPQHMLQQAPTVATG
jgi:nucleotide-binding universal stress UspA family protein